jgi:hypothetical protein
VEEREREIERMKAQRERLREEKMAIEEKRLKREGELAEQNEKLHGLMAEEFEHSFKDKEIEEVDDVEDRFDWRDEDTSYENDGENAESLKQES